MSPAESHHDAIGITFFLAPCTTDSARIGSCTRANPDRKAECPESAMARMDCAGCHPSAGPSCGWRPPEVKKKKGPRHFFSRQSCNDQDASAETLPGLPTPFQLGRPHRGEGARPASCLRLLSFSLPVHSGICARSVVLFIGIIRGGSRRWAATERRRRWPPHKREPFRKQGRRRWLPFYMQRIWHDKEVLLVREKNGDGRWLWIRSRTNSAVRAMCCTFGYILQRVRTQ